MSQIQFLKKENQISKSIPLLNIEELHIDYLNGDQVIKAVVDFNLTIAPGQKIGLVGESGSGKSTIAYAIMNYMGANRRIRSGNIQFQGRNLLEMNYNNIKEIRGNRISMIYQEAMNSLNPVTTVGAQMLEVPTYKLPNIGPGDGKKLCLDTLAQVKIKDPIKIFNSYPFQLSGGQQQRVVIAMALMTEPNLLIMDEPTTALDVTVEAEIMELVEEMVRDYNTALLLISHNLGLVINTCDDICVLYSGQVLEQGSSYNILHYPQHPYTGGLFKCIPRLYKSGNPIKFSLKPIPGQLPLPWERPQGCWFKDRCEYYQIGPCDKAINLKNINPSSQVPDHDVRCVRHREIELFPVTKKQKITEGIEADFHNAENLIEVNNLIKHYTINPGIFSNKKKKRFTATQKVNFQIKEGEILSIVGESGSGKSTIAKMIVGLEKTSDGKILFYGREIGKRTAKKRSFDEVQAIQMIFQNPSDVFNPKIKIRNQIIRTIHKFLKKKKKKEVNKIIEELMEIIRMPTAYLDCYPHQLSGGQKQRVAIARTYAGNPSFIVADEPTSALDVSVQASIVEMLMEMQSQHQNTLLFISHDLSLVSTISDRVIVLYAGEIMEIGPTEAIFTPPYHPYSAALISATPDLEIKPPLNRSNQNNKKESESESLEMGRIFFSDNTVSSNTKGCPFASLCSHFIKGKCDHEKPSLKPISDGHYLACHQETSTLEKISW